MYISYENISTEKILSTTQLTVNMLLEKKESQTNKQNKDCT